MRKLPNWKMSYREKRPGRCGGVQAAVRRRRVRTARSVPGGRQCDERRDLPPIVTIRSLLALAPGIKGRALSALKGGGMPWCK